MRSTYTEGTRPPMRRTSNRTETGVKFQSRDKQKLVNDVAYLIELLPPLYRKLVDKFMPIISIDFYTSGDFTAKPKVGHTIYANQHNDFYCYLHHEPTRRDGSLNDLREIQFEQTVDVSKKDPEQGTISISDTYAIKSDHPGYEDGIDHFERKISLTLNEDHNKSIIEFDMKSQSCTKIFIHGIDKDTTIKNFQRLFKSVDFHFLKKARLQYAGRSVNDASCWTLEIPTDQLAYFTSLIVDRISYPIEGILG